MRLTWREYRRCPAATCRSRTWSRKNRRSVRAARRLAQACVLVSLRICPYFRICQYRRPRSESGTLGMGELTRAAGLGVENPQLLVTTTRRCEHDVPPVGSPGRIFVLTFAGELLRNAIPQVDRPDLEISILLLVCDRATVGRPVRTRAIAAHAWGVGSEQLNVGAIRIHN